LLAACGSARNALDLSEFRGSDLPYFYVGQSFDGLRLIHIEPCYAGVAFLEYGTPC